MKKWKRVSLYLMIFAVYTTVLLIGVRYLFGALVQYVDDWLRIVIALVISFPSLYCLAKIVDIMDKEKNQDRM